MGEKRVSPRVVDYVGMITAVASSFFVVWVVLGFVSMMILMLVLIG